VTNSISGLSDFEELVEVIQRRLRWDVSGGCLTCEELVGGYSYKDNNTNQEVLLPSSL